MQSISLERGDLLQLAPISNTGTIKLLSPGKKKTQKLVTGDDSGNVGCYEFKKGEPQVVFSSKLFDGAISCIAVGGTPQKKDKIFAAHSQRIVGVTKKGKEFFKLTSSLTEDIRHIVVEDTKIYTGCEFIYNLYDNGADAAFYMSRDQINALAIENISRDHECDVILGCQDNRLRVVQGSKLLVEVPTMDPVTALATRGNDYTKSRKTAVGVIYGTENGSFSAVQIQSDAKYRPLWTLEDSPRRSAVKCMQYFDLVKDGRDEIIVARDDGRLDVYTQESGIDSKTTLAFSKDIGESILSAECGLVNNADYNEIVIASYSGKVISFTAEPVLQRATDDNYGRSVLTVNNENRIKHLKKELEELKKQVEKESANVKRMSGGQSKGAIAAVDFPVNAKFTFDKEHAAYLLSIELQSAIDIVILRSPVVLDLVDSDLGASVVSVTPPHMLVQSPGDDVPNKFVAALRCQGPERRISLMMRTTEGEFGDLVVTIVANLNPSKAAKIMKFPLRPLSLHHKVHVLTDEDLARPRNRIRFAGQMPLSTAHEWIQALLPEVPPHIADDAVEEKCFYKNAFTGACTVCEYRRNEIIVESESASTIAIAKETITRMANYRRIQLDEALNSSQASVGSFLSLIRNKLVHQLTLNRKVELVDAIQEIVMQEPDISWLSPEYKDILDNQETIRQDVKRRAKSLEFLVGIVTDLFVDWNRLQGIDARSKIPLIQEVIMNSADNFDSISEAFLRGSSRR